MGRPRLTPEQHRLRGTYQPARHDPVVRQHVPPKCNWRLRPGDLDGLSPTAVAFVKRADKQYHFNDKAGEVVLACGDAIDRLTALREAIQVEGERIRGS